jgi:hypothetical protein
LLVQFHHTVELCHKDLQANPKCDEPSGKTPRKRKIVIPEEWELTKDHQELIEEFRTKSFTKDNLSKLPLSRRFRDSNETLDDDMEQLS